MYIGSLQSFTNREDWVFDIQLTDDTGEIVDFDDCDLVITVRNERGSVVLSGESDDEITIPETGTASIRFDATEVHSLCAGTYSVGMTITDGTNTSQLFVCTVQVIDGIVP